MMKLALYSYWRSSASWRVRAALHVKGLDFDYLPVHLVREGGEQHTDAHASRNPMRQLPTLRLENDEGRVWYVSQSLPIIELLDELYPDTSLLPRDPFLRAHTRQLAEIINSGTQPLQNLSVIQHLRDDLSADPKPFCQRWISKGLHAYQSTLEDHSGRFSVGDQITLADICLVPQLYNARRFDVDLSDLTRLLEIEAACVALPSYLRAHPDHQPDTVADA